MTPRPETPLPDLAGTIGQTPGFQAGAEVAEMASPGQPPFPSIRNSVLGNLGEGGREQVQRSYQ